MDHLTEEKDKQDQVMLPTERFDKSSEPNESVVVTGENPSCIMVEGEEQASSNVSLTAPIKMTQSSPSIE